MVKTIQTLFGSDLSIVNLKSTMDNTMNKKNNKKDEQEQYFQSMHNLSIILKAMQYDF